MRVFKLSINRGGPVMPNVMRKQRTNSCSPVVDLSAHTILIPDLGTQNETPATISLDAAVHCDHHIAVCNLFLSAACFDSRFCVGIVFAGLHRFSSTNDGLRQVPRFADANRFLRSSSKTVSLDCLPRCHSYPSRLGNCIRTCKPDLGSVRDRSMARWASHSSTADVRAPHMSRVGDRITKQCTGMRLVVEFAIECHTPASGDCGR